MRRDFYLNAAGMQVFAANAAITFYVPWREPAADEQPAQSKAEVCEDSIAEMKCTRPLSHEGDHLAHGKIDGAVKVLARWPRKLAS